MEVNKCNEIFGEIPCFKVNQLTVSLNRINCNLCMEPEKKYNESNFQPHSKDSDSSRSSESPNVSPNNEINVDVQDEGTRKTRSKKYEVHKHK